MTAETTPVYPKTASILSLIGGLLIVLVGALLMAVSAFILPHVNFGNITMPSNFSPGSMTAIAQGVVGVMGTFGLVSGIIIVVSAIMLLAAKGQRRTWGVLIVVFSVLSFLGLGGFVVGAILALVGGVMALRWKPRP